MSAPTTPWARRADDVLALVTETEQALAGTPYQEQAPRDPRAARGSAARRHRRSGEGRQVDAAQRARRRAPGADRRRRVHAHRLLVPARARATQVERRASSTGRRRSRSPFQRVDGALRHRARRRSPSATSAALDVRWPASTLDQVTLIDTPGLASLNDENSRRTRDFLELDGDGPSDADAVIYLMRHLHRSDVEFLDAFMDRSVTAASPVNAVAVLSRADEIGAGRLDAMDVGRPHRRPLPARRRGPRACAPRSSRSPACSPRPGLTLREDEVGGAARARRHRPTSSSSKMLLSADQFCDLHASDLTVELRRDLLDRLGMFGVRLALQEIRANGATTAAALGPRLVEHSGLGELRRVIAEHFLPAAADAAGPLARCVALRALARDGALGRRRGGRPARPRRGAHRGRRGRVRPHPGRPPGGVGRGARSPTASGPSSSGCCLGADAARGARASGPAPARRPSGRPRSPASSAGAPGPATRWPTRRCVEVCETAARTCEALYASVA